MSEHFEIKSCPLCGHPACIEEVSLSQDTYRMKIVCTGCGVSLDHTQEFMIHEVRDPVTGEVIKVNRIALNESTIDIWNRRVKN